MKVKIIRGFCLGAGKDVYPGDEIEVDDRVAAYYIASGKAEPVAAPPALAADPVAAADEPTKRGKR